MMTFRHMLCIIGWLMLTIPTLNVDATTTYIPFSTLNPESEDSGEPAECVDVINSCMGDGELDCGQVETIVQCLRAKTTESPMCLASVGEQILTAAYICPGSVIPTGLAGCSIKAQACVSNSAPKMGLLVGMKRRRKREDTSSVASTSLGTETSTVAGTSLGTETSTVASTSLGTETSTVAGTSLGTETSTVAGTSLGTETSTVASPGTSTVAGASLGTETSTVASASPGTPTSTTPDSTPVPSHPVCSDYTEFKTCLSVSDTSDCDAPSRDILRGIDTLLTRSPHDCSAKSVVDAMCADIVTTCQTEAEAMGLDDCKTAQETIDCVWENEVVAYQCLTELGHLLLGAASADCAANTQWFGSCSVEVNSCMTEYGQQVGVDLQSYVPTETSAGVTSPVTGVTSPVTGVTSPVTGVTSPVTGVTSPVTGVTSPVTGVTSPDTGVTSPDTGVTSPVTGATSPGTMATGASSPGTGATGASSTGMGATGASSTGMGATGASSTGMGATGASSTGMGATGASSTGMGASGASSTGMGATGASSTGMGATGASSTGMGATGASSTGMGATGASSTGVGATGASSTGMGATGASSTGMGATGASSTGMGATGASSTGMGATGASSTGMGATGASSTGMGATGASSAGMGATGASSTGMGATGASSTGMGATGASSTGMGATGASSTGMGATGASSTGMGSTGSPYPGTGSTGSTVGANTGSPSGKRRRRAVSDNTQLCDSFAQLGACMALADQSSCDAHSLGLISGMSDLVTSPPYRCSPITQDDICEHFVSDCGRKAKETATGDQCTEMRETMRCLFANMEETRKCLKQVGKFVVESAAHSECQMEDEVFGECSKDATQCVAEEGGQLGKSLNGEVSGPSGDETYEGDYGSPNGGNWDHYGRRRRGGGGNYGGGNYGGGNYGGGNYDYGGDAYGVGPDYGGTTASDCDHFLELDKCIFRADTSTCPERGQVAILAVQEFMVSDHSCVIPDSYPCLAADGQEHEDGESWTTDCVTCTCNEGVTTACSGFNCSLIICQDKLDDCKAMESEPQTPCGEAHGVIQCLYDFSQTDDGAHCDVQLAEYWTLLSLIAECAHYSDWLDECPTARKKCVTTHLPGVAAALTVLHDEANGEGEGDDVPGSPGEYDYEDYNEGEDNYYGRRKRGMGMELGTTAAPSGGGMQTDAQTTQKMGTDPPTTTKPPENSGGDSGYYGGGGDGGTGWYGGGSYALPPGVMASPMGGYGGGYYYDDSGYSDYSEPEIQGGGKGKEWICNKFAELNHCLATSKEPSCIGRSDDILAAVYNFLNSDKLPHKCNLREDICTDVIEDSKSDWTPPSCNDLEFGWLEMGRHEASYACGVAIMEDVSGPPRELDCGPGKMLAQGCGEAIDDMAACMDTLLAVSMEDGYCDHIRAYANCYLPLSDACDWITQQKFDATVTVYNSKFSCNVDVNNENDTCFDAGSDCSCKVYPEGCRKTCGVCKPPIIGGCYDDDSIVRYEDDYWMKDCQKCNCVKGQPICVNDACVDLECPDLNSLCASTANTVTHSIQCSSETYMYRCLTSQTSSSGICPEVIEIIIACPDIIVTESITESCNQAKVGQCWTQHASQQSLCTDCHTDQASTLFCGTMVDILNCWNDLDLTMCSTYATDVTNAALLYANGSIGCELPAQYSCFDTNEECVARAMGEACIQDMSVLNDCPKSCDNCPTIQKDGCRFGNGGCGGTCNNIDGEVTCTCDGGFTLQQDSTCQDINECDNENGGCDHTCTNSDGTFECSCNPGYTVQGTACPDIDECLSENGDCAHTCTNEPEGSHTCTCNSGYDVNPDGLACDDVDECAEENGGCQHNCNNTQGSHFCTCRDGFDLKDQTMCEDENECEESNGGCAHNCTNTQGSFECSCKTGYRLKVNALGCEDVNECDTGNGGCKSTCTNKPGTFICSCEIGFILNADGLACDDADECAENKGGCDQICLNSEGSFTCDCREGYALKSDRKGCYDADVCGENNGGCAHNCAKDPNVAGSFVCSCDAGYMLKGDLIGCDDIDECLENMGCSHECKNTPGSYDCACPGGFTLNIDGKTCKDDNECEDDNGGCDQICDNTEGSYECRCRDGYELNVNEFGCDDIDECSENEGLGDCDFKCTNKPGGYVCSCDDGYKLNSDNSTCDDIDECIGEGGPPPKCEHECENKPGTYACVCDPGYKLKQDGFGCFDINECLADTDGCAHTCTNSVGSFDCGCSDGYILNADMKTCDDVDECLGLSDNNCEQTCTNTQGSYECGCGEGYSLDEDGVRCHFIDVCGDNNGGCEHTCAKEGEGFQCSCHLGYTLNMDGFNCDDDNECTTNTDNCDHTCTNTPGGFDCSCDDGYTLNIDGHACDDYDECTDNNGGCTQICTNTAGSYVCSCNPGFTLHVDGHTCDDKDECLLGTHDCSQKCLNKDGGFTCSCEPGYNLNADGRTCDMVTTDPCANYGCEYKCEHDGENAWCVCDDGYKLDQNKMSCTLVPVDPCANYGCEYACEHDGENAWCVCEEGYMLETDMKSCMDKDECLSENGGCPDKCVNTDGSFYCDCFPGYWFGRNWNTCEDIDECRIHNGGCPQKCNNMDGSYSCACYPGYTGDGGTCTDINECMTNNGDCDHNCTNTEGGYMCSCERGFSLRSDGLTCEDTRHIVNVKISFDLDYGYATQEKDAVERMITLLLSVFLKTALQRVRLISIQSGSTIAYYEVALYEPNIDDTKTIKESLENMQSVELDTDMGTETVQLSGVPQMQNGENDTYHDVTEPLTCDWEPCSRKQTCVEEMGDVICLDPVTTPPPTTLPPTPPYTHPCLVQYATCASQVQYDASCQSRASIALCMMNTMPMCRELYQLYVMSPEHCRLTETLTSDCTSSQPFTCLLQHVPKLANAKNGNDDITMCSHAVSLGTCFGETLMECPSSLLEFMLSMRRIVNREHDCQIAGIEQDCVNADGREHYHGDTWPGATCEICGCDDGVVDCWPDTSCELPKCEHDWVLYDEGEMWTPDQCTECRCVGGAPECSSFANCDPLDKEHCYHHGMRYNIGDEWMDNCNQCICFMGDLHCTTHACPIPTYPASYTSCSPNHVADCSYNSISYFLTVVEAEHMVNRMTGMSLYDRTCGEVQKHFTCVRPHINGCDREARARFMGVMAGYGDGFYGCDVTYMWAAVGFTESDISAIHPAGTSGFDPYSANGGYNEGAGDAAYGGSVYSQRR